MSDLKKWQSDLSSPSADTRKLAAEQLSYIGTDAAPAAIELVRACGDDDDEVREYVVAALEELGTPPPDSISEITELLRTKSSLVCYWAATLLGRLEHEAKVCQNELAELLACSSDQSVCERAAWALEKIGADSPVAIESLAKAAKSGSPRLERLALAALERQKA